MRTSTPLKSATGAIRHFWWLALLLTLIGVLAAEAVAARRPPTYQASAALSLDATQSANQGFDIALQADQFLSQRYIQMATSQPVLDTACSRSQPRCDPTALARRVIASDSKATGVIQVNVSAGSPGEASRLANAIVDEIIAHNNQQIDDRFKAERDYLQQNLKQQNDRVQQIKDQLSVAQRGAASEAAVANAIAPLLADLNQAQTQLSTTSGQLQQLGVEEARIQHSLSVLQRATPPTKPIDPNPPLYGLVGFMGGLMAGLLAALLAELLDDRIRDSGQLAEAIGSPLVLEAGLRGGDRSGNREATSYSLAYASMLARHDPVRAVLVVATTYGDRVDDVGVGLATAAAQWGNRVLVIQSYPPDKAADDAVFGEVTSRVVIEAASSQSNGQQLASADGFDLIIACTPPPGYSPNAMSFVSSTDLAIVVATRRRSRSRDARWAADLLRHTGVKMAGAVLLDRNGGRRRTPAHLAPLPGAIEESNGPLASAEAGSRPRTGPLARVRPDEGRQGTEHSSMTGGSRPVADVGHKDDGPYHN